MPPALPSPIPRLGEHPHKPLHSTHQIRLAGLQQQMEMISHHHPRVHTPTVTFTNLPQPSQPILTIPVVHKNILPPIPACHHMVNRSGRFISQRSSHSQQSRKTEVKEPNARFPRPQICFPGPINRFGGIEIGRATPRSKSLSLGHEPRSSRLKIQRENINRR